MIRPWNEGDIEQLRPMVEGFLREVEARGGDMAVSDHNVAVYIALGLKACRRGEPTCLWEEDGRILSFCLWTTLPSFLEYRMRTIWAVGAFTLPEARRHRCAQELRDHAEARAFEMGFDRIAGPVHTSNRRGQEVMAAKGAWPMATQWELWREGRRG